MHFNLPGKEERHFLQWKIQRIMKMPFPSETIGAHLIECIKGPGNWEGN